MLTCEFDSERFERKLYSFENGLSLIFHELLKEVGNRMSEEARALAPRRTGSLARSINFLGNHYDTSAFTTRKSLSRWHIWYANPVEHGSTVTSRGRKKTGEYTNRHGTKVIFNKTGRLFFKIDGEWKTVDKTKPRAAQPFMKPVFDKYFGDDNSLGYRALTEALQRKMTEGLS